jgi:(p)ppGpp synthase/HD superfamily hydrolase
MGPGVYYVGIYPKFLGFNFPHLRHDKGLNMWYHLGSIEEERTFRLRVLAQNGIGVKEHFLECVSVNCVGSEKKEIIRAYDFAIGLDYDHAGLSSKVYLAHPLRVAEMTIGLYRPLDPETVKIALLHNALEVGGLDAEALTIEFGSRVADAIATLTVDRSRQWDLAYKQAYYDAINASPTGVRAVKVLDKLDNIFTLCLNSDEDVRNRYLAEIKKHVIPMADLAMPHVGNYLRRTSENARLIGYKPIQ